MENKTKRVSFYPSDEKNKEFLKELKKIVNKENSSIAECTIQRAVSNNFCVFIIPKNPKYSFTNITFNFSHSFDKENDGDFIEYYEKEGLNKEDILELNNLFKKYTFENYYEGLFFASKFFQENTPINLYLKFSEDEKNNKYIVEGHKVSRHYSMINREDLKELLKNKLVKKDSSLIKCNFYGFSADDTVNDVIKKFNKKSFANPSEVFVIEYYRDYETIEYFLSNIFQVVDNELIKEDIKMFLGK